MIASLCGNWLNGVVRYSTRQRHAHLTFAHQDQVVEFVTSSKYTLLLTTTGQTHHSFPQIRVHFVMWWYKQFLREKKEIKIRWDQVLAAWCTHCKGKHIYASIRCEARSSAYRSMDYYYFIFDIYLFWLCSFNENSFSDETSFTMRTIVLIAKHVK